MSIIDEPSDGRKPQIENNSDSIDLRRGDETNPPAAEQSNPAQPSQADLDPVEQDLRQRLETVRSTWSPGQREKLLQELIGQIAVFLPELGSEGLVGWLEAVQKKWKECRFTVPAMKVLREQVAAAVANLRGVEAALEVRGKPASRRPASREFVLINDESPGASEDPAEWGILEVGSGEMLTNFGLSLVRTVTVADDLDAQTRFEGTLTIFGKTRAFEISTEQYASDKDLREAIYRVAGPEARVPRDMSLLREAVSTLSKGQVKEERRTTGQGWNAQGTLYRVQSGQVTSAGFVPLGTGLELQVDLQGEELARHLDLQPLAKPAELTVLRSHVVKDLLQVHDRRVTYPMLGAVGVALLHRFAGDVNRFAIWLTGLTGSGKSFLAQLFMNFFGRFRPSSGSFATWASTANFIQRQGYFFKDALYLVDDYKPDVVNHNQVVRILQAYADNTGRGRLKSDATTNATRPIRGLLISTGEDIPEHSSSALARSVVIEVPQQEKDISRGQDCMKESGRYTAVTVDCLRWFLANGRAGDFKSRFEKLQRYYYQGIAGKQNDIRIASNLALLASGFIEMAKYLGDVWSDWRDECFRFVTEDLIAIRDRMLEQTHEQQPSEVFLSTLRELLQYSRVVIEGFTPMAAVQDSWPAAYGTTSASGQRPGAVIGKAGKYATVLISPPLAMEAVQESLKKQGRPPLAVTQSALEEQLLQDGKLLDRDGSVLKPDAARGGRYQHQRVRFGDADRTDNRARCIILPGDLLGGPRPIRPGLKPKAKASVVATASLPETSA
jgi:hypothetical protein